MRTFVFCLLAIGLLFSRPFLTMPMHADVNMGSGLCALHCLAQAPSESDAQLIAPIVLGAVFFFVAFSSGFLSSIFVVFPRRLSDVIQKTIRKRQFATVILRP